MILAYLLKEIHTKVQMLTIIIQSGYRTGRTVFERDWNLTLYFVIFIAIALIVAKVYDWLNNSEKSQNTDVASDDEIHKILKLFREIEAEYSKCEHVIIEYRRYYNRIYNSNGPEAHSLEMTYNMEYRKLHEEYEEKTKRYKLLVDYIYTKADKKALKMILLDFEIYNTARLEKALGENRFKDLLKELSDL